MKPKEALFVSWALFVGIVLSLMLTGFVRAQGAGDPIEVPVLIDRAANTATIPLDWFAAIIEAHNHNVKEVARLKATSGCS